MKTNEDQIKTPISDLLELLKETPQRDPKFADQGKTHFLAEARTLQGTISPNPMLRLKRWMSESFEMAVLNLNTYRKEHARMFKAISSILLVFAVLFGGSGVTAYAAQDSLPNSFLYPVKLFLEDTRYTLTSSPESQVNLLVTFANNRVDEILGLTALGEPVPESLLADLRVDLDTMLELAADMEEGETQQGALIQIRDRLRTQDYIMEMSGQPEDVNLTLVQLQHMLQAQHQRAGAALEDPLQFKHMFRNNQENSSKDASESEGEQNADCPDPGDCESYQVYEWGDPGNENPGNDDQGNADSGNADPGNPDPGNADPGNTDPGNTDPGNPDPGNTDPGNTDPGNPDPGNPDPGSDEPGDPDPGKGGRGNDDPGKGSGGGKP
jgi:hypothetical protein